MSIESLKEQARRHEQKEEWQKALGLYTQAIDKLAEEDQPDIGLYNRAGDLCVRIGNVEAAVGHYEQAVDLYVEAELPNNAIAICKKVIRNLPNRHSIYLKMGQIRAQQGFLPDARANFLTYAERMQQAGDLDESFRALVEFADLAPDDVDVRLAVADQMAANERQDEAVEQLSVAYRTLMLSGQAEQAAEIEERIHGLNPDADLSAPPPSARDDEMVITGSSLADDDAIGGSFGEISLGDSDAAEPESAGLEPAGLEPADPGTVESAAEEEPAMPEPSMEGFDISYGGGFGEQEPGDSDEEEEAEPLPTFGLDDEEDEKEAEPLPTFGLDDEEDEEEAEPLPTFGLDDEEDEEEATPLPMLDMGATGEVDADEESGGARERAFEETSSDAAEEELTLDEVRSRIESRPDDVSLHQRMVELAYRQGDERALAEAYLGLAGVLERAGQTARANAAYQQVLDVDPENEAARAALGQTGQTSLPVHEVASSEDYVDLGSMILGDEGEKTTRFVVAYEEPSGDEQADFAKMLSQFKEKVSENLDADDVRAHHDLGTAYKEMGLLDEAIGEFQQALRASADHLPTYELLGQTFLEMGNGDAAVRSLKRALEIPFEVEDEMVGIYYYLARAYELIGDKDAAVEYYDQVFSLDINFADVTERLRALR